MALVVNGDGNITGLTAGGLPDASITQADLAAGVSGNGPAFSAFRGTSNQSISSSTWTKVQLNNEIFDTNSNFDNSTNYRFTPTVSGYYQVNYAVYAGSGQNTAVIASIYKNGSEYKTSKNYATGSYLDDWGISGTVLLYLNGTTDYIELYAYLVGSAVIDYGAYTHMDGFLARAA